MSTTERILRGESAATLINDPVYREAMDASLRFIQSRWAATDMEDSTAREMLYHQFTAVHTLDDMLNNFIEDGTRAEREEADNGDKSNTTG